MDRLVITVHGIRTFGHWQRRLEDLLVRFAPGGGIRVDSIDYGYFSVLAFFLPFVRWLATRRIRKLLLRSLTAHPWRRIDIVAHSFGTYLVGWSLQGLTADQRKQFRIHTLIFAGSVLRPRFPWDRLLDDRTGCINRVVNDCGIKDKILLLSQVLVPLASMAGRVGFRGVINERFRNRYFPISHSGYFVTTKAPNDFMERWWVPLLTTEAPIESHDERSAGATAGLVTFLINNAELAKLLAYSFAVYCFIYSPIHNLVLEAAKARRTELVTRLAEAALSTRTKDEDVARPVLLARQAYLYNERFQTHRTALVARALREVLSKRFASVTLRDSKAEMTAADFSRDGRWLAVANDNQGLWLWELEKVSAAPIPLRYDGGVIRALRFQPDAKGLIAVTDLREVLFWDLTERGRPPRRLALAPSGEEQVFAISHDARWLAAGLTQGQILVWQLDALDRAPIELCCHLRAVSVLAFHPQLPILASGSFDQTVRLWNRTQPGSHLEFGKSQTAVSALAWHPKGRLLAVGTKASLTYPSVEVTGADVLIGDAFARPHRLQALGRHKATVSALQFSPDGQTLASAGSGDRTIMLWRHASPNASPTRLQKHQGVLTQLLFDPRGRYLLSIDVGDRGAVPPTARLWYLGEPPAAAKMLKHHKGPVTAMTFAPKGSLLASVGGIDATLAVYDVQAHRLIARFDHGEANAETVRFSPDGKTVASGSKSGLGADAADFRVRLWDVDPQARAPRRIFDGHRSAVLALAFSTDGHWLASSGHFDREIRLWDLRSPGSEPAAIIATGENQVLAMAFRPGMSVLAWAGTDCAVYLKDIADHAAAMHVLRGHKQPVRALVFTPDGEQLVSGGIDKKISIWNPDKAQDRPMTVLSQPSAVMALSVGGSGRMLASAGEDGRVQVWDLESIKESTEAEPAQLDGPGKSVLSISFSEDGRWLAAGGANGKIAVWPTASSLAERACLIARRNLTEVEWRAAIGGHPECTCPDLPGCSPSF